MVATCLARLEGSPADRQSRHSRRLAQERIPFVLDMESPSWQARAAQGTARGSGSDSDDEPQQPSRWGAPRIRGELLKFCPLPDPVRIPRVGSRSATHPPLRRNGSPNRGVDSPATPRSISMGQCTSLSAAGSRPDLPPRVHRAGEGAWNQRSVVGAAIAVAKGVC